MTLSEEQLSAVAKGQDVRFFSNGVEYVIIRSEVLAILKARLESDHQDLRMMLAQSAKENGWDEPGMEAYDSYPAKL